MKLYKYTDEIDNEDYILETEELESIWGKGCGFMEDQEFRFSYWREMSYNRYSENCLDTVPGEYETFDW